MHAGDMIAALIDRASAFYLAQRSVQGYISLTVVFSIAFLLEVVARKQWRPRYLSPNFRLDVFYYFFYYGGLYHLLVFIPLYGLMIRGVRAYAPFLQMNLMAGASAGWQIVIAIFIADFFGYWIHRVKHTSRFLWMFHAVHHSQERLTVMTNFRFHVVDETLLRIGLFIPFLIAGTDFKMWLAVDIVGNGILFFQHTEWNWTYGRFGRLVVSPRFHQIHHSTEPEHQNRNFAMLMSFWDDLFGTAERRAPAPTRFGIAPDQMPETFLGQLVWPFARLLRDWRSPAPALPEPTPTAVPD